MRRALLVSLAFFVVGCASRPPINTTETLTDDAIALAVVVPSDSANEIKWPSYSRTLGFKWPRKDDLSWTVGGQKVLVVRTARTINHHSNTVLYKEYVRYDGTLSTVPSDRGSKLAVTLAKREYYADLNLDNKPEHNLQYAAAELIGDFQYAELPVKMEFDSDYTSEALYASFKRLARSEPYDRRDDATGRIFKERFYVKVDGNDVPVFVETYPYRKGSKVVIYGRVRPVVSAASMTADFTISVANLRKALETIVNS